MSNLSDWRYLVAALIGIATTYIWIMLRRQPARHEIPQGTCAVCGTKATVFMRGGLGVPSREPDVLLAACAQHAGTVGARFRAELGKLADETDGAQP
jgi:hypothetical protein